MSFYNLHRLKFLYCVLFIICLAVYGNTFFNDWTYDDIPVVVQNSDSHSFSGFMENKRPGRPLRELTYIPEYKLFGTNPAGYHIQQIAWHTANGCLLLLLFTTLGIDPLFAVLGVLLFCIHPLQSESVANISHRKELLPLFFCTLAAICYLKAVAHSSWQRLLLLLSVAFSYWCALQANETSVTFPLLLILYDYLYVPKERRILLKYPVALISLGICCGGFLIYRYQGLFSSDQLLSVYSKYSFIASKSFIPLWMADLKAYLFYISNIILPIHLAPEYQVYFYEGIFQPLAWFSAMLILTLLVLFFYYGKKSPNISFAIGWFFIFYLPISNLIPVSYLLADRYMYLCLPAIGLAVATILQKINNKKFTAGFSLLLVTFAILTIIQNSYWKNEDILWRHAVTVNPDSTWVQETVALSYLLSNQFDKARDHAKAAITLNRYNTRAYLTLAKSEDRLGNLPEAIKNFELFTSFGIFEYPDEVTAVKNYLPYLRRRAEKMNPITKPTN